MSNGVVARNLGRQPSMGPLFGGRPGFQSQPGRPSGNDYYAGQTAGFKRGPPPSFDREDVHGANDYEGFEQLCNTVYLVEPPRGAGDCDCMTGEVAFLQLVRDSSGSRDGAQRMLSLGMVNQLLQTPEYRRRFGGSAIGAPVLEEFRPLGIMVEQIHNADGHGPLNNLVTVTTRGACASTIPLNALTKTSAVVGTEFYVTLVRAHCTDSVAHMHLPAGAAAAPPAAHGATTGGVPDYCWCFVPVYTSGGPPPKQTYCNPYASGGLPRFVGGCRFVARVARTYSSLYDVVDANCVSSLVLPNSKSEAERKRAAGLLGMHDVHVGVRQMGLLRHF